MSDIRILALGDSITFGTGGSTPGGYRASLSTQLDLAGFGVDFVGSQVDDPAGPGDPDHEGYPGILIDGVNGTGVSAIAEDILVTQDPDVILLMIGTNNAIGGQPGSTIADDLGRLIDYITDISPNAVLLVSSIPPSTDSSFNAIIDDYNAAIPQVVAERQQEGRQVVLVDAGGAISASDLSDGVHPNDAGYTWISYKPIPKH